MADLLGPKKTGIDSEAADFLLGQGSKTPNPTNMGGLIDSLMGGIPMRGGQSGSPFMQGGLARRPQMDPARMKAQYEQLAAMQGSMPAGGNVPGADVGMRPDGTIGQPAALMGGGGGAPMRQAVQPQPMRQAVQPQPMPMRSAVQPQAPSMNSTMPAPAGPANPAPRNVNEQPPSQGPITTQSWIDDLLKGGKTKYPPGMEKLMKEYFAKQTEALNMKAPNYKGDRVANATAQMGRGMDALNQAGRQISNPDSRFGQAVAKQLDPTKYATNANRERYASPVVVPGAVGNSGGSGASNPGGQQPFRPAPQGPVPGTIPRDANQAPPLDPNTPLLPV